jgi:hypothetical protein
MIDRKPSILKNTLRALLAEPLPKKGSKIQRQYSIAIGAWSK